MTDDLLQVTATEHFRALAHPLRQRLLSALAEPATISQLAATMRINKGNIAYHLRVLREAGLIAHVSSRQVRGGTEEYYQRITQGLHLVGPHSGQNLPIAFRAIAAEIAAADPDPFLVLRHLTLTPAQAERLAATLAAIARETQDADAGQPRYGMLLGLYRSPR